MIRILYIFSFIKYESNHFYEEQISVIFKCQNVNFQEQDKNAATNLSFLLLIDKGNVFKCGMYITCFLVWALRGFRAVKVKSEKSPF